MHTLEGTTQAQRNHAKKIVARHRQELGHADWPTFWQEMMDAATPVNLIAALYEMACFEENARLV